MQFYDDLAERLAAAEARLAQEARTGAPEPTPASRRRRAPVRWPRLAVGSGVLVALALIVIAAWPSTAPPPRVLGALETPTADASGIRRYLSPNLQRAADLREAHPFPTPAGPGYVFQLRRADGTVSQVCAATPDGGEGYGVGCAPLRDVEGKGLVGELIGDAPTQATVTLVLPVGENAATFTPDGGGPAVRVPAANGVVVFEVPEKGVLRWNGPAGRQAKGVIRSFPPSTVVTQCADGEMYDVPSGETPREVCRTRDDRNPFRPERRTP